MIKSVVKQKKEKEPYFPKLMVSTINESIVLFLADKQGTLIKRGTKEMFEKVPLGAFITNWNMTCFVEYKGQVTLENI